MPIRCASSQSERLLYVVISTQGDGDPPDDARGFVEFLAGKRAPRLTQLKFAVLGLGDTSYPQVLRDRRNASTRASPNSARAACSRAAKPIVDIDTVAAPWLGDARCVTRAKSLKTTPQPAKVTPLRAAVAAPSWHRARPFAAPVLVNQRITARESGKDVRHIELSLEGSGLPYEPGDSLGVWPPIRRTSSMRSSRRSALDAQAAHRASTATDTAAARMARPTSAN